MAKIGAGILDTNDVFPEVDFQLVSGNSLARTDPKVFEEGKDWGKINS